MERDSESRSNLTTSQSHFCVAHRLKKQHKFTNIFWFVHRFSSCFDIYNHHQPKTNKLFILLILIKYWSLRDMKILIHIFIYQHLFSCYWICCCCLVVTLTHIGHMSESAKCKRKFTPRRPLIECYYKWSPTTIPIENLLRKVMLFCVLLIWRVKESAKKNGPRKRRSRLITVWAPMLIWIQTQQRLRFQFKKKNNLPMVVCCRADAHIIVHTSHHTQAGCWCSIRAN